MKTNKLTSLQKDVLKELGNIGAGNATTSLSKLINKEINMEVPSVSIVTINEIVEEIGGPEEVIVTVLFKIEGEITGTVFFVLTMEEAEFVLEQMGADGQAPILNDGMVDQMAESVLTETANILTGSYLSALADMTGLHMQPTIPFLSVDMAAATLVSGLIDISQETDYAILIDTKMTGSDIEQNTSGQFLLIPDPASIPKLFSALGIKFDG